jgi:hypothetical protein
MANFRGSFGRVLAVLLGIVAALGALYGLPLMVTAVTGSRSPGSILLGGLGLVLLVLSLLLLVFAGRQWTSGRPGQGSS